MWEYWKIFNRTSRRNPAKISGKNNARNPLRNIVQTLYYLKNMRKTSVEVSQNPPGGNLRGARERIQTGISGEKKILERNTARISESNPRSFFQE